MYIVNKWSKTIIGLPRQVQHARQKMIDVLYFARAYFIAFTYDAGGPILMFSVYLYMLFS